ncbi:MAG: tetratricopeptide repeat protein [Halioglobus sp.]
METYRDENEQVEALRRWWEENGRATLVGVVLALGLGFGWQGWQKYTRDQADAASDVYQAMIQRLSSGEETDAAAAASLAQQLKSEYSGTTYAQFAALHLAADAVTEGDLVDAQAELRWVLGKADKGSDVAEVAQLRLARVLAAGGDVEAAMTILNTANAGAYQAAYAVARGDVLLAQGKKDEARQAYSEAQALLALGQAGVDVPSLGMKLQSLTPVPPRALADSAAGSPAADPSAEGAAQPADAVAPEGEG